MSSLMKVERKKRIIIIREVCELSNENIKEIIIKGATACQLRPDYNIVFDFREATWPSDVEMKDIFYIAMEISKFKTSSTNKIAAIVPKDNDRLIVSKKFEAAIQLKGIQLSIFTDMTSAQKWLGHLQTPS